MVTRLLNVFDNGDGTTTYAKLSAQFTAIAGHDYSMRLQHKPTATTADSVIFDDASLVKTTA